MALTINNAPTNLVSINDEILFVLYESVKALNDVTYPDYRYVADIYVSAVFVGRIKVRPDPTYKMGIFNVAPILRSYVTYGVKANFANEREILDAKLAYTVKFGEEYADTLYTNLLVDVERTTFKSYAPRPFDNSDVVVDGEFASNIPSSINSYKSTKWLLLSVYKVDFTDNLLSVLVTFYNSNGGVVTTGGYGDVPVTDGKFVQLNFGFAKLVSYNSLSQTQQDQISYYIITLGSQTVRVDLLCEKYTPLTLAWLNPFGAYDAQDFGLVNKKTVDQARKDFSRLNYQINSTGVVSYSADGVFYGSKKGYSNDVTTKIKLTSHLLTASEYTWLADLFNSPDVYMYDTVLQKFFPVSIAESNYEYRTYLNSKLTPLEFNVQFSDNYNSQML